MKHQDQRKKIDSEIEYYGRDILNSEMMRKAFDQTHHLRSTVGEHTMRVTRAGVKLCHALEKLHIPVDVEAVVVASLCHDLGILDRDSKYSSTAECYKNHAEESVMIAKEMIPDLPEKAEEIIRRHMWPLHIGRVPNSVEAIVVTAADKYTSVVDLFKGSGKRNY